MLQMWRNSHFAKDCRSSETKIRKYKEEQRQRAQELQDEELLEYDDKSGFGFMCQLCEDAGFLGQISETRRDRSNRLLKFRVDSGATVTVVPKDHPATRGYKTWRDNRYGRMYRTAAKNQVKDEGLRALQT